MATLFDGLDGRSDGTATGFSKEISGTGPVNIHVFGTFDGGEIVLQRFSHQTQAFENTDLKWTVIAHYQGLQLTNYSRYRLNITSVGASTAIVAEIA